MQWTEAYLKSKNSQINFNNQGQKESSPFGKQSKNKAPI